MTKVSKFALYATASFGAVVYSVCQAVLLHKQFFPTIVALTASKTFLIALANGAIAFMLTICWIALKCFFSPLHVVERQKMSDKFYYYVIETGLCLSYFRSSMSTFTTALFFVCGALKTFHNLAAARQETMEQQLVQCTRKRTVQLAIFLLLAFHVDIVLSIYFANLVATEGFGVYVLLLLETTQMALHAVGVVMKLLLHQIEVYKRSVWDAKCTLKFYVDIVVELTSCVLYTAFFITMCYHAVFPFHLVREVLINFKRCVTLLGDFVFYKNRVKMLDRLEEPTPEQLEADPQCSICYGEMMDSAKRLPCGHCFHKACLCRWLEHNKTCPYCLQNIDKLIERQAAAHVPNAPDAAAPHIPAEQQPEEALRMAIEEQIIRTLYEQYKTEANQKQLQEEQKCRQESPKESPATPKDSPATRKGPDSAIAAYERYHSAIKQAEEQLRRDLDQL